MKLTLPENICRLRKAHSMTQEQLAEALGVTFAAVSKWERGIATPDLSYITEMAGLFEVSLDVLVGYQVYSGVCAALEQRIFSLQQEKKLDEAAREAEKALVRYPNDFCLVYRCGELYQLKGLEHSDPKALERSIELLNHSLLLLSQNTDPEINEYSIRTKIALCYISLGRNEQGLELLKKYNIGGIHNALIGMTYSASEADDPEAAIPYLTKAFANCITEVSRVMNGYANYYARKNDPASALDAVLWLTEYLESVSPGDDTVTYMDKLRSAFYAACAHLSDKMGKTEDMAFYLRKAFSLAQKFDASPTYNIYNNRFAIGELPNSTAYDDVGATAMDSIEGQMRQGEDWSDGMRALWQKLKEENGV
ncbi:MAG: helix-turn-helix domain-containing protein [bacterium]|nr:helix-turn-helix domain-containing protein [bacterium]